MFEKPFLGSIYRTPVIGEEQLDLVVVVDPSKTSPRVYFLPVFINEGPIMKSYILIRPWPYPEYIDCRDEPLGTSEEEIKKKGLKKLEEYVPRQKAIDIEDVILQLHPNLV